MIILSKIYKHKCSTKIQKHWYDELILVDDTMMNRFELSSWILMT